MSTKDQTTINKAFDLRDLDEPVAASVERKYDAEREAEMIANFNKKVNADVSTDKANSDDQSKEAVEEVGGQAGLEPTRFGDWERKGRCSDF